MEPVESFLNKTQHTDDKNTIYICARK